MSDVKPRRVEYVEQTRESLLVAAEDLFTGRGFAATSIDAVGAAARFTKGAVYRHFPDKRALFRAVFERVEVATVQELERRSRAEQGAVAAARVALATFLDLAGQTRFRRIVLEEGPVALGYREWRALDHGYTAALLDRLLGDLAAERAIPDTQVGPLARMVCTLVGEAAVQLAEAGSDADERGRVLGALRTALGGLDPSGD